MALAYLDFSQRLERIRKRPGGVVAFLAISTVLSWVDSIGHYSSTSATLAKAETVGIICYLIIKLSIRLGYNGRWLVIPLLLFGGSLIIALYSDLFILTSFLHNWLFA